MATPQNFQVDAGRTVDLPVTLTNQSGSALDLTGATLVWEVASGVGSPAVITKSSDNPLEIEITNTVGGLATIHIVAADTVELGGSIYAHSMVVTGADGSESTVFDGFVSINASLVPTPPSADPGVVLSVDQFRAIFRSFRDTDKYSDAEVSYWISQAILALDVNRWGQFYDQGLRLYVAHMLAVNGWAETRSGGLVGSGIVSSRSVGGVSVGYDNQFGSEEGAGNWNMTVWGQQYIRLAKLAGSGGYQL